MLDMLAHRFAVVMAGGAGTRFWPASRRMRPKQFLALGPDKSEALIQATVRRLRKLCPPERIIIATGRHLARATAELLPELPACNILAEPAPRNTAPCIAWATATVLRRDPDAVLAVLSADHLAEDEQAFHSTVDLAMNVAAAGAITTIGIVPTRPETGYGYIEAGGARPDGAHDVVRFVEKPDLARAEAMVQAGSYLWNSGFFFYRGSQMMQAVARHLPSLSDAMRRIDEAAATGQEPEALDSVFPKLDAISIDYGVMEKLSGLAVVRGSFGWTDVGSWQTVWELADRDSDGNSAPGDAILVDCRDNLVADLSSPASPRKAIALVGVQGLAVIETDDAVLVIPRSRSQDVRHVVSALPGKGHGDKL